jgi:acetyl esterase/lipase
MRLILLLWATALTVCAQNAAPPKADDARPYMHQPDMANVAYGSHERNVFDFWKAPSDRPTPLLVFIHGGAFVHGDMRPMPKSGTSIPS